jgi:hypothetical protein
LRAKVQSLEFEITRLREENDRLAAAAAEHPVRTMMSPTDAAACFTAAPTPPWCSARDGVRGQ